MTALNTCKSSTRCCRIQNRHNKSNLKQRLVNLTPKELELLTGAKRADAQARELEHLGIPYKTRRDGTLVVLRVHVDGTASQARQASPALRLP